METTINLASSEFIVNPYPFYTTMRQAGTPYRYDFASGSMWMITRYQDVASLLKDAQVSKDITRFVPPEDLTPFDHNMLSKDPPDHTRLRALSNQAFTPARVRDLEPRITAIVDDLIARGKAGGGMEFIRDFALPLPIIVIAELLGVPVEERDTFHEWSNRMATSVDAVNASEETRQQSMAATQALGNYFLDLIERRRAQPKDDLISALVAARDAGDQLTQDELLGMCMLLLIAGHETTVNLLGNGMYALLRHPDQLEKLRQDLTLMPSAVEEMLRFESPVQRATYRFVREAHAIGGTVIEAGQQVSAVIGAANRDPDQFPDPDRFDITRSPNRHLSFGLGIHFCLGAPLARAEARIGFTRLLQQLPVIRLSDDAEWSRNTFFRGLKTLPLAF